ncbi:SagB family peptide dehydrogenase [Kitasatospora sp. NA04385]|uniref:SagB family peptide dehydrogenase n=1 Tax=Kitasatospora sp. NA04385 TaxID=2742135 RepID=UPI0015920ABB|nr:SagB family peptide dehydrogenase [Kitasatospora sp. NA04385]QKW21655.1 SagB family peptide dehydrogenase [Kitasatospora sp. NA04385]
MAMRIDNLVAPQLSELWSLREDTLVESDDGQASLTVHDRWGTVVFEDPDPALRQALERMTLGPVSLSNVLPGFPGLWEVDRPGGHGAEVTRLLRDLDRIRGSLVRSLALGGTPVLSVVPLARGAWFTPRPAPADRPCRLSRFTVMRWAEGGLRLESPLAHHRVQLHRSEAMLLLGMLDGTAQAGGPRLDPELARTAIGYLVAARIAVVAEDAGEPGPDRPSRFTEDDDPRLVGWSPDDLLVHSRSRLGRSDGPFGATYAHQGRMPAEPVVKPLGNRPALALYRPDLEELRGGDEPFTSVLERRRSVRDHGPEPLTEDRIGELLFRACRVRESAGAGRTRGAGTGAGTGPGGDGADAAWSDRPYPSMGSVYGLELYLVAGPGTELAPGAYHYDPLGHLLEPLDAPPGDLDELRSTARTLMGSEQQPPLLLVITARFRRATHAFSGIAYTSLLKDVGVLLQNLYLVATAMDLAPCALASGNSDTAARAFGLDWPVESSVGEFVVGTKPREADPPTA